MDHRGWMGGGMWPWAICALILLLVVVVIIRVSNK
jgi:hypothetical protein